MPTGRSPNARSSSASASACSLNSRARQWAPWVLLALVALIVMAGLGLAGSVVGGGERHINVIVALVSLLGLHALTLLLWLAGLWMPLGSFNTASLGWIWLSLTARVAGGKRGQAPVLVRATTGLLSRAKLLPWAFGLVSHGIWSLSFAVVLAAMLFALAFRSYTLSWETTILDPDFFVRVVQVLGWAPAKLGFPVPDAATVLAATPGAAGQRTWALWLTGCIVVYGLLPRVVLVLLSAFVWKRRRKALARLARALLPQAAGPLRRVGAGGHRRCRSRSHARRPARGPAGLGTA